MVTVIDAKNLVYGRLATNVADLIMKSEEVVVLNAEQLIITGEPSMVFATFKQKVDRGDISKRKGPYLPRRADLIFKRCVWGMIPRYTTTGREAYRKLHVFVGEPKQFVDAKKVRPAEAVRELNCKYVTLGQVAEFLGSTVR
ncbi:MAG: 50S ribosomal protein L13 [Candidatus Methanomethylophilus sp.]|nr:50S ribosomal protein L13 [Methanomethylophilus sp.]MDD4222721.1 50S ribosomal protein L13 [Methanomethylophilus sp.]MDD4669112.1 50S ribosomal protein L13 [Methanomethylophilus sp.]